MIRHCMLAIAFVVTPALMGATELRGANVDSTIIRNDFIVTSDPGVEIYVREVADLHRCAAQRGPVLLVHGARVPGVASFDLPVPEGSLAVDLAAAGHTVYMMDARGYGRSTRPPQMDGPRQATGPLVRLDEVVRDIDAVVEAVRTRNNVDRVGLLGWATGGHWVGQYASLYSSKVSHLILYNSLYGGTDGHPTLGRGSNSEDPQNPGQFNRAERGAYCLNTVASLFPSWDQSIPIDDKTQWRDPAVAEAYGAAALASDPTSATRNPPSFRAPTGAIEDSFYLATGRQLWDASLITAPTLIVRAERDFWSRPEDVQKLIEHLVSVPRLKIVTIPQATHFVHLDRAERGRSQFVAEVQAFLAE